MRIERFSTNPLITPQSHDSIGGNINGPSLIRVPEFIQNPLGRYYLYFAHHTGDAIRLAYAQEPQGPYTVYAPGTLRLEQTPFIGHIASPDVHVDAENKQIVMFFHGVVATERERAENDVSEQANRVALSGDGIHFTVRPEILGNSYPRVFSWDNRFYLTTMQGELFRAPALTGPCRRVGSFWDPDIGILRHSACLVRGDTLYLFYSLKEDLPERILVSRIHLAQPEARWRVSPPEEVLRPERDYEGADCPFERSKGGAIHKRVHQLRDPAIFEEGGRVYLLYSIAGEHGIAGAQIAL